MQLETIRYASEEPRKTWPSIVQIHPLSMPRPPTIPGLINGQLASMWISMRLQHLQLQWRGLLEHFTRSEFQQYQFALEATLVSMKRVIDDLIMGSYCIHKELEINDTSKIEVDGWGGLFRKGVPTALGREIIDQYVGDYDSFPDVLNDLVNALKHSYLMPEARNEWNNHFPLVKAISAPHNDYSGVVKIHDHDMAELVLGFNKFVTQVVRKMHPRSGGPVLPLNF